LLQRISSALIRAPHNTLGPAIQGVLADLGMALGADQTLLVMRDMNGLVDHRGWQRGGKKGRLPRVAGVALAELLDGLDLPGTLVCGTRRLFPAAFLRGETVSARMTSAIIVPLPNGGRAQGVLAVAVRKPRSWARDVVNATEWLADMLAAGMHRLASLTSLAKEQEKRVQAEAETRALRDQIAHAGRVSMLGELAASLAHELNQPLTAIYTNAQAAQRFLDRRRPALGEALGALRDLGLDCRRAADVLGRLREMFGRHETERVQLSVGPLIEHVLKLLHEEALARGVNVFLDVKPDLPLVKGDRVQLEQVAMNLLVNAFDAVSGVDGPRQVTVRVGARAGGVLLAVLDNGRGIPRSELGRIFEPFFSRKPGGMGMGLAICRTIVEAHGGRITARNRTEGGAVFEVTLPANPAGEADVSAHE
jgi:C4-dicarboxylate-specific signal transduction histidine kinase